jgi:hypothetical protein
LVAIKVLSVTGLSARKCDDVFRQFHSWFYRGHCFYNASCIDDANFGDRLDLKVLNLSFDLLLQLADSMK